MLRFQAVERVAELLEKAVVLERGERAQYLERACAGDEGLRREVESLIEAHERAGSGFLNQTPAFKGFASPAGLSGSRSGARIGAYLLQERIGHGGMGEVYAAVRADGQYEKRVALKLVRGGWTADFVLERFRTERQILAGLDHPNIARLLDGGTEQGTPYLVMELVEGEPIDAYCARHGSGVARRLELFGQVCAAVQYAHQRLVIHRDIKPGNILVTADGVPKLLDFGIAKMLDASGNSEATVLRPMTPEFASPEQIRGEPVTTATDVYSLGVVLYRLLTGRSPYGADGDDPMRLAAAIGAEEARRPSAVGGRQLRGDLDSILLKALRKEPQARYGSAEQFADDIRRHLEGLPVAARKGTWSYRAGRFLRRHYAGAGAGAALLATLVAAVGVTQREARLAETSQRRAEARFNDVRKLANSLLFEINDSIKNVPGATQARHLILQRSLEYLDGLARESGNDAALLRELATAYRRIGALQGNPQESNIGQTGAAFSSVQKAIQIREALARLDPRNSGDQVELATLYLDYAEMQMGAAGNVPAGVEYCRKALAILDRESAAFPDDSRIMAESVRGYMRLGMMQVGEGAMGRVGTASGAVADLQRALTINQRRAARAASDPDVRRQDVIISVLLADVLFKRGERVRALELYRRAFDALTSVDPEGRSASVASNAAVVTAKIGDVQLVEGRYAEAVSSYASAERAASRLAAADPHDKKLLKALAADSAQLGFALIQSGRTQEGLRNLRQALALAESDPSGTPLLLTFQGIMHAWIGVGLEREGRVGDAVQEYARSKRLHADVLAGGARDPRMQVYFASAAGRLAAAYLKLGRTDAAGTEYDESLAHLEPLLAAGGDDQEVLYAAAETYAGKGAVATRLAERDSAPAQRHSEWQAARGWFRKSLSAWDGISNPARISTSGIEVTPRDEVSRRLARCDSEIRSLGVK